MAADAIRRFPGPALFARRPVNDAMSHQPTIHPDVRIGHVHLTVSDLSRSLRFYRDVLGFEVTQTIGDHAAFLSAGGY